MSVRSYQQYCGLARSLDVIGDRWSMLIIREVALRDCRYTDLRDGLPGMATNLLADRLRGLVGAGVIERTDAPPPIATSVYRLTSRGTELLPALHALVRWSLPLMLAGPSAGDSERARWVAFAATAFLRRGTEGHVPITVLLDCDGEQVALRLDIDGAHQHAVVDPNAKPDLTVAGSAWHLMGLVSGAIAFGPATRFLTITGTAAAKRTLREILELNRSEEQS